MNHNEGSRDSVLSYGGMNRLAQSKPGSLHPSFCQVCGLCYSEPRCLLGYLIIAEKLLFRRFLEKVNQ